MNKQVRDMACLTSAIAIHVLMNIDYIRPTMFKDEAEGGKGPFTPSS